MIREYMYGYIILINTVLSKWDGTFTYFKWYLVSPSFIVISGIHVKCTNIEVEQVHWENIARLQKCRG